MYGWLNGPGAKLRYPLPGSTNYLGAYDKQGNLLRATAAPTRIREDGEEGGKEEEPTDGGLESRINSADKDADTANNELPRENRTDLTPFPLNKQFYSQPVLSEELRERIYETVVKDNLPLSIASTSYKVSMERVAAVVRLKTMEKQWEEQVSYSLRYVSFPSTPLRSKDEHKKNSISLEDSHMVKTYLNL